MAETILREGTLGDAQQVALHMRVGDVAECSAVGLTPFQAVMHGYANSVMFRAATDRAGQVLCVLGIVPLDEGKRGIIWMLGTPTLALHRRALTVEPLRYIDEAFKSGFQQLLNYVPASNTVSTRWLARCGFTLHPAVPYGIDGQPFHLFTLSADEHRQHHARQDGGPSR